jgi:hypothetical protein
MPKECQLTHSGAGGKGGKLKAIDEFCWFPDYPAAEADPDAAEPTALNHE